jgi:hypothetical protein
MATIQFHETTHATPDAGLGHPLRLSREGRNLADILVTHGHENRRITGQERTARV